MYSTGKTGKRSTFKTHVCMILLVEICMYSGGNKYSPYGFIAISEAINK